LGGTESTSMYDKPLGATGSRRESSYYDRGGASDGTAFNMLN